VRVGPRQEGREATQRIRKAGAPNRPNGYAGFLRENPMVRMLPCDCCHAEKALAWVPLMLGSELFNLCCKCADEMRTVGSPASRWLDQFLVLAQFGG
jgi:hypothetical protein